MSAASAGVSRGGISSMASAIWRKYWRQSAALSVSAHREKLMAQSMANNNICEKLAAKKMSKRNIGVMKPVEIIVASRRNDENGCRRIARQYNRKMKYQSKMAKAAASAW
jgi:hypothetical protein